MRDSFTLGGGKVYARGESGLLTNFETLVTPLMREEEVKDVPKSISKGM